MVYLDEMIERLETARDINTETEEADGCIDDVIADLQQLKRDFNDVIESISEAAQEHEVDLQVITAPDDATYNGGYIDALVNVKKRLKEVIEDE
jgi:hypothetical protein